jgi:hypothetical protein
MIKVTWRNRRNTRTPTKAFDVSDVRRVAVSIDAALVQELERVTNKFQRIDTQSE